MDWDELAPLTDEQSESINELQQMITKLSPIVHDIDKTKLKIIEPSVLSTLPSNHKLRDRYKEIQLKQQQLLETKDEKYDDDDDEYDEYKYRQKPPKFNYVNYFINQMKEERNTPLQLTDKQQESWNYLTENANYMRNVVDSISALQNVMKQLNEIYIQNENQCAHIHNKCMHLISEQKELEFESLKLRQMVKYFADYNQIRTRISSPKLIDVLSKEFHNIVIRINECINFLINHKQYAESDEYLKNYQLLRIQCIKLIKHYIQQRLEKAQQDSKKDENNEGQITILEYRAAASLLRPLILLIENESKICENYATLLNDLQKYILNERHNLLAQLVDKTILTYSKTRNTPNLIRASTSYVMMICLREYKLYNEFFDLNLTLKKSLLKTIAISPRLKKRKSKKSYNRSPRLTSMSSNTSSSTRSGSRSPRAKYTYIDHGDSSDDDDDIHNDDIHIISGAKRISGLIKDLCSLLYSYLRPFIIKTSSMQILCDIIHILQGEIQEHLQLTQRQNESIDIDIDMDNEFDSNIPEFDRTIVRIIEDAQERLVFRTQIHLRDEIQNYEFKENDLDYYGLLKKIYSNSNSKDIEEKNENENENENEILKTSASKPENENENENEIFVQRYSDWSPILEKTLSVLSKVYPVLNHSVFEFLAYEAVSCSVTSLVELARKLAHSRSSVHGHLFLIKHLLILREQISPFDVDFSITETTLDFGHMTQYLANLVSSRKYSLVEVFQHSIPTVNKHQLNSKKSMESVLKKGCESFIETQTNLLIGPLIALIAKYKQRMTINKIRKQYKENEKKIHPLEKVNSINDNEDENKKENDNMNDDEKNRLLNELNLTLDSCEEHLMVRIGELMDMMKLYLQNELTQRILLKPIISNIQSAFIQLRKIVIETNLKNDVKLNICDNISDKLQTIVNKSAR